MLKEYWRQLPPKASIWVEDFPDEYKGIANFSTNEVTLKSTGTPITPKHLKTLFRVFNNLKTLVIGSSPFTSGIV